MPLFSHVELHSKDPDAARKFYSGVFGWTYTDVPMPDGGVYTMVATAEGEQVGGIVKKKGRVPQGWIGYTTVASVKRTVAKAERRGAKVVAPYTKVVGMGAYAIIKDPLGAAIGIWEDARKPAKKKAAKKAKKKAVKKK